MATQQHQPGLKTNDDDLHASGEEIIKGARNEDQLDSMRDAAATTDVRDDLNEIRVADDLDEPDQTQTKDS
jgi:hypothetical protein